MNYKTVKFSVRDNTNIYNLELAKALLYFTEYDFTYFWEQCIDAGRQARSSGRLPQNIISNAKNIISKAHPYIEAMISSDFADICTDCIIEYICQSEMITLDELWTRCISSKNLYENTIFKRISQFKTNRAINGWVNIVRLQEYARNKISFIYDPDENGSLVSRGTVRTRRDYFDLASSVAANELGFPCKQLPSTKLCTSASLPESTFIISKVSKAIYKRYSETFAKAGEVHLSETMDYTYNRDKIAMDSYSYIKGMTRPALIDMKFALEAILETPEEVYFPDSFKAIIDLEFNLMYGEDIYIRKCVSCSRYFAVDTVSEHCDRVNSSGKTCREAYEETIIPVHVPEPEPIEPAPEAEYVNKTFSEPTPYPSMVKDNIPPWRLVQPPNKGVPVPAEMEKHGQRLYNAMYKRIGSGIDENEFREWSQYLSNMKRNVKIGEATLNQLEDFLKYSDNLADAVKAASKQKKNAKVPVYNYSQTELNLNYVLSKEDEDKEIPVSSVIKASDVSDIQTHTMPSFDSFDGNNTVVDDTVATATVVSYNEQNVKPFMPESFNSLADAMMMEHSNTHIEVSPENLQKAAEKPALIKEPEWQRLTREEAYAQEKIDIERYKEELFEEDGYGYDE